MNNQKGFAPILILVGVLIIAGLVGGAYYFSKTQSVKPTTQNSVVPSPFSTQRGEQTPQPTHATPLQSASPSPQTNVTNKKTIHLYPFYSADPSIKINDLHIVGVFFSAKDIETSIKPEWPKNMEYIFSRIKKFYEREFENNIIITYEVMNQPVRGDKNIGDYSPETYEEVKEIKNKLNITDKDNVHNVLMIYIVEDFSNDNDKIVGIRTIKGNMGGAAQFSAADQGAFWLDDDAVKVHTYGITGSAHEFGHALGIPHPWEMPANTNHDPNFGNVPGSLMGYSPDPNLDKNYLRDDVKKGMGL